MSWSDREGERIRETMRQREARRAYQRGMENKMFEALDWFARQYEALGNVNRS